MTHSRRSVVGTLVLAGAVILCAHSAFATARVLSLDFTVNQSWSYTCSEDSSMQIGTSTPSTNSVDYTLTSTVTEDNLDGSFDITLAQTNLVQVVEGTAPRYLSADSEPTTVVEASGRMLVLPNADELLSVDEQTPETWNSGSLSDISGLFVPAAVDVNDTWTVQHSSTPYGQSAQTVTATATLKEWTTLNGYNVAKVEYTWNEPMRACKTSDSEPTYISGTLACKSTVWIAYAEKKIVKVVTEAIGTDLDYRPGAYIYSVDSTTTTSQVLN